VRNFDFAARAVIALIIGYSAFLSEIFRAGIESIERGQVEAALSLGMTRWQVLRHRRPAAGDPPRAAAAGQRLHCHAQRLVARLRAGRAGHYPDGKTLRSQHLSLLSRPTTSSHSSTCR
jgi:hypothetical protein